VGNTADLSLALIGNHCYLLRRVLRASFSSFSLTWELTRIVIKNAGTDSCVNRYE
jgi:hypothetical protein